MSGIFQTERRDDGTLAVACGSGLVHLAPVPVTPYRGQPTEGPNRRRITQALDLMGAEGPEVDEALGVLTERARVVDYWELGAIVPSAEDVGRLATLTGYSPDWFHGSDPAGLGHVFICGPGSWRYQERPEPTREELNPPFTAAHVRAMTVADFLELRAVLPALVAAGTPDDAPLDRRPTLTVVPS